VITTGGITVIGEHLIQIGVLCATVAASTCIICLQAEKLGQATRLLDKPDGIRKLHKTEVPLIGGLAVLVPSFILSIFYISMLAHAPFITVAIVASAIMLIIGVADDRVGLSAAWRFLALFVVCLGVLLIYPLFVLHALRLGAFGHHIVIPLSPIAIPVTVLMLMGFVNAVNMADGMNGQLLGSIAIWCAFISYYLGINQGLPFLLSACSAIVALIFNLRGRLFCGSSGAYAASLFVGLGAIAAYRSADGAVSADMPLVWFWLPVLDCLRVMTARIFSGRSPFAGDRHHIHHVLLEYLRPRFALVAYLALLAAPGLAVIIDETFAATVLLMCASSYATLIFFHYARLSGSRQTTLVLTAPALPSGLSPNFADEIYLEETRLRARSEFEDQQLTLSFHIEQPRAFINGTQTIQ
jgi:UDP-GlcNAc:undecaprenyl-phosphate GlcNAc-1-phosphate transferase